MRELITLFLLFLFLAALFAVANTANADTHSSVMAFHIEGLVRQEVAAHLWKLVGVAGGIIVVMGGAALFVIRKWYAMKLAAYRDEMRLQALEDKVAKLKDWAGQWQ